MSEKTPLSGPVVVLFEAEARYVPPVADALSKISPDLQVLHVENLQGLDQALDGKHPDLAPDAQIRLLFLQAQTETHPQALKTRHPERESWPEVIVTHFEHHPDQIHDWAESGVFNLVYKPYDPLLLKQHLQIALNPAQPPRETETYTMKTKATIEMLKEIPMELISEVGLVTRSDRDVPSGRITKLYAKIFAWNDRLSIFARSLEQRPHPSSPQDRQVLMTWFGVGRDQMLKIRSRFPKQAVPLEWRKNSGRSPSQKVAFLIIGDPSAPGSEIAGTLSRQFSNLDVVALSEMPSAKAALPSNLKAIFFHRSFRDAVLADPRFKDLVKVVLMTSVPSDAELRADSQIAVDLIALPSERVSLFKKVAVLFPELQMDEGPQIGTYPAIEKADVGQPIEINEMSESGLSMKYERPLPVGTIRRFVLWQPAELGLPILTARCFLNRADPSGQALNHFVFFGMSDTEIKHIRVWMRDHFIQEKNKS